jgi:hypothetical protein
MSKDTENDSSVHRFAGIITHANKAALDDFSQVHGVARGAIAEVAMLGMAEAASVGLIPETTIAEIMKLGKSKMREIRGEDGRKARHALLAKLKGYSAEDIENALAQLKK